MTPDHASSMAVMGIFPSSGSNLAALRIDLTAADMKELEDGFAAIRVQGARAPEALMAVHDIGANPSTGSAGGHGLSPLPQRVH
jgi:hypothetical protein